MFSGTILCLRDYSGAMGLDAWDPDFFLLQAHADQGRDHVPRAKGLKKKENRKDTALLI